MGPSSLKPRTGSPSLVVEDPPPCPVSAGVRTCDWPGGGGGEGPDVKDQIDFQPGGGRG